MNKYHYYKEKLFPNWAKVSRWRKASNRYENWLWSADPLLELAANNFLFKSHLSVTDLFVLNNQLYPGDPNWNFFFIVNNST